MRRQNLDLVLYLASLFLFIAYWLTAGLTSHLCLGSGALIQLCRIRLPLTLLNLLDIASGVIGSLVLSVPLVLLLSAFGIHDRTLGQDYVGYYQWALFLVVFPGLIALLVLRLAKKRLARPAEANEVKS